ncbi:hypothetical protein B566_EDAN007534, partial [Ephemera danica]
MNHRRWFGTSPRRKWYERSHREDQTHNQLMRRSSQHQSELSEKQNLTGISGFSPSGNGGGGSHKHVIGLRPGWQSNGADLLTIAQGEGTSRMSKSDSFEAAMWPILNALRIKGYFPVKRRGRKLEFSLMWLFFDIFICIVTYGPAFVLIYRGLQVLLTQISACSSLHFDKVHRWTRALPLFLILPFIGNMVVTPALGQRLPNLAMDFYLSLISSEMILMLVWWRGTMQAISDCSRALLAITNSNVDRILAFRSLWLSLCELLRDAGNVFPLTYIGLILLNVFICSYSLFELLAFPQFSVVMHFIFYLTLPFIAFTVICIYPQRATTQIYNDILKAMEITQHQHLLSDLKSQFFAHLRKRPPEVSLQ